MGCLRNPFARCLRRRKESKKKTRWSEDGEFKATPRELMIYLAFLTVLCIIASDYMGYHQHHLTKTVSKLFLDAPYTDNGRTLRTSTHMVDFWRFERDVLRQAIYWERWYNGDPTDPGNRGILHENHLLGSPRLRQLRVLNDSCSVPPDFQQAISECFNSYWPALEDTRPFGLGNGSAIVFEFPATGGLVPSWSFQTVKLLRAWTPYEYTLLVCEAVFCFFPLYYLVEEICEVSRKGAGYLSEFWNVQDILILMLAWTSIALRLWQMRLCDRQLSALLYGEPGGYPNLEEVAWWTSLLANILAIMMFLSWLKAFKYISFNRTMTQLSTTLAKCSKDIAGFGLMFFIVFFAFAQLGFLLFGTQVEEYSSFPRAVFSLLRLILGDFNFYDLEAANRILGPIYFLSYVFFVFFVLMNMFLAIINDSYSEVKSDHSTNTSKFSIGDFLKKVYNNVREKLGNRDPNLDLRVAINSVRQDPSFDHFRSALKRFNFPDLEIEMVFAEYDLDDDQRLSRQETDLMKDRLESDKPPPAPERPCAKELHTRLDRMTESLQAAGRRIETALSRLSVLLPHISE